MPTRALFAFAVLFAKFAFSFDFRIANATVGQSSKFITATSTPIRTNNATSSIPLSSPASTCCYMSAYNVGVNTWYSKPYVITAATVITTWVLRSGNLAPANSTTISVADPTSLYGSYEPGQRTSEIPYATTTFVASGPHYSCRASDDLCFSTTGLYTSTEILYTNKELVPSAIPSDLLPSRDDVYGRSIIGSDVVTFSGQANLVLQSPTPYLQFNELLVVTSWACATSVVETDTITIPEYTTISGTEVSTSIVETHTASYLDFGTAQYPPLDGIEGGPDDFEHYLLKGFPVEPFPDGDYSNFSYDAWLMEQKGYLDGGVDGDGLKLGDRVAKLLGQIPFVTSQFPQIATCTLLGGNGEPTVHIPVSGLTITQHVTLTVPGDTLTSSSAAAVTSAPSLLPSSTKPAMTPASPVQSPVASTPGTQDPGQQRSSVSPSQGTYPSSNVQNSQVAVSKAAEASSPNVASIIASLIAIPPASRSIIAAEASQANNGAAQLGIARSSGSLVIGFSPTSSVPVSTTTVVANGKTTIEYLTPYLSTVSSAGSAVSTVSGWRVATPAPTNSAQVSGAAFSGDSTLVTLTLSTEYVVGSSTITQLSTVVTNEPYPTDGSPRASGVSAASVATSTPANGAAARSDTTVALISGLAVAFLLIGLM